MKTKKKNRFLTFCFSCLPGAAEMYMGFMKIGVSLMLLFFTVIMLATWLNQGAFAMIAVVIWFYSFFHANHLAGLTDEEFNQVKDDYLLDMDGIPGVRSMAEKNYKWVAGLLIFFGVCFLWNSVKNLLWDVLPATFQFIPRMMRIIGDYIPGFVIGVVIIYAGVKMITGKGVSLPDNQTEENQEL